MEKQSTNPAPAESANHGEGNPEAAENFNKAERAFVESARGEQAIREGTKLRPDEEAELAKAEDEARSRSKGDDSTCLDGM
jgi:hypothetical protein